MGGNVTRNIGNGIIGSDALTTTGAFNYYISCYYLDQFYFTGKIPISGSGAVVSAVFGFGLASVGPSHIHFNVLAFIVLIWIFSPIIGFASVFYCILHFETRIYT